MKSKSNSSIDPPPFPRKENAMGLDHGKLKKRRAGARFGGWRPKEGENRVRVLPPHSRYLTDWESMEDVAVTYKMHYFKIEGRPTEVSRCLEELGQRCPACEAWRIWRKSDDPGMKEIAGDVSPADTYLLNIIDVNNTQAGVQYWSANYTCWDKILEIVANDRWGNPVDPSDGVNFTVNLTGGNRSRSGYNTYSVTPEPQRTQVLEVLAADPDWQAKLDSLADQITEPKTADEIRALLEEMGFPPMPERGARATAAATAPATPAGPAPVAPAPGPRPVPVGSTPAANPPQSAQNAPESTPVPVAPTNVTPAATAAEPANPSGVHYDPGPDYEPKVPDAERPPNAPRCFGDFNRALHQCEACPVMVGCQMKMIGIQS